MKNRSKAMFFYLELLTIPYQMKNASLYFILQMKLK